MLRLRLNAESGDITITAPIRVAVGWVLVVLTLVVPVGSLVLAYNPIGGAVVASISLAVSLLIFRLLVRPRVFLAGASWHVKNPFQTLVMAQSRVRSILVERYSLRWFERGPGYAIYLLLGDSHMIRLYVTQETTSRKARDARQQLLLLVQQSERIRRRTEV